MPEAQPIVKLWQLQFRKETESSRGVLAEKGLELTYNGRSALLRACKILAQKGKGRKVLIPGYHCPACVTPVLQAGLEPAFYRITREMAIDWDDLLSKISADVAAVMVIHFFGIESRFDQLDEFRRNGVAVIEDWSHSFLRDHPLRLAGRDSDFRIYSFWKMLPLQAGGALVRSTVWRQSEPTSKHRQLALWDEIKLAKRLFEEALQNSDHEWAKKIFASIENLRLRLKGASPPKPATGIVTGDSGNLVPRQDTFSMPWISERVMRRTALAEVLRTRQENYAHYAHLFRDIPGIRLPFPEPGTSACPWLFPMIIEHRERFSTYCRQHGGIVPQTFASVLHDSLRQDKNSRMVEDALYLANHVVCLPIHQDLATEEIEATGSKLLDYFRLEAGNSS